jgi:hypothetical protein
LRKRIARDFDAKLCSSSLDVSMSHVEYKSVDFAADVAELFKHSDFNFGKGAVPIQIVKEAVLKSVCGWHNGSTAQSIIVHLGYVETRRNKADKLTAKGKAFLWWAFKGAVEVKKCYCGEPSQMFSADEDWCPSCKRRWVV